MIITNMLSSLLLQCFILCISNSLTLAPPFISTITIKKYNHQHRDYTLCFTLGSILHKASLFTWTPFHASPQLALPHPPTYVPLLTVLQTPLKPLTAPPFYWPPFYYAYIDGSLIAHLNKDSLSVPSTHPCSFSDSSKFHRWVFPHDP